MGNQGQNMFTILTSAIEFCFSKQGVRKIYLPRNKTTKDVKKFQDGGLCICREEIHMRYIVNSK